MALPLCHGSFHARRTIAVRFRTGVFLRLDVAPYALFQEPSKLACLQRRGIARCGVAYRRPLATLVFIGLHRAAPSMPRFPSIPCKLARSESLPLSLASPVSDTGLVVGLRAVTRASVQPLRCGVRTSNGARLCGTLGAVLCVLTPRLQPKGARTIRESGVSPSVPGLIPLEARWHSLCIMSLQAEARRTLCRWRVFQTSQFPVCCALVGTHS
jgi:hypothetical protein